MSRRRHATTPTWKRNTLAGAITLALASLPAASALAATCPGTLSGTTSTTCSLTGTASTTVSSGGAINVAGASSLTAVAISSDTGISLTNKGTISAAATATGTTLHGVYAIYDSGALNGAIDNSGTISASATLSASGTNVSNTAKSVYGIDVAGGISGSLTNSGTISATVTTTANAKSNATPYALDIYGVDAGTLSGSLTNSGTISASGTTVATGKHITYANVESVYGVYASGISGNLTNSGTISASGTTTGTVTPGTSSSDYVEVYDIYGIEAGAISGSLSNSGTISATATGTAYAPDSTSDAVVYATSVYGIYAGGISGSLSNSGTISATATANASGSNTDADASAYDIYGIYDSGNIASGASLTNSGTISATATATGTNSKGNAYAYADYVYGIYQGGALDGSLSNSGHISATGTATATLTASAGTTDAYGEAYDVYGVYQYNGISGSLSNSGSITATATGTATADTPAARYVYASGSAYGIDATGGISGSLSNSGAINATATASLTVSGAQGNATDKVSATAYGIDETNAVSGSLSNSGTILATAKTSLSATPAAGATVSFNNRASAYGVYVGSLSAPTTPGTGALTNTGTIIARADASGPSASAHAYGVDVNTLYGTLTNSGTIIGVANDPTQGYSISAGSGSGTIVNQAGGLLYGDLATASTINLTNAGNIIIPAGPTSGVTTYLSSYTQLAGGSLTLGAASATSYDTLSAGTVDLTGSDTLNIIATPNNTLAAGDTLTGVVSATTLTGVSNGATISVGGTPLFTYSGVVNGNAIDVTVTSTKTISQVLASASGPAYTSLGNTLDGLAANYTGYNKLDPVLTALYNTTSAGQLSNDVEQLAPAANLDMNRAELGVMQQVEGIVQAHQTQGMGLSSGDGFVNDRNFWFKPFASHAKQGDRSGVSGYSATSGGLALGADERISNATRLGGAFSYARTNLSANSVAQSGSVDAYQLVFYGSHTLDPRTQLSFQADYGTLSNNESRSMLTGVYSTGTSTASYNGTAAHLGIGVSRSYRRSPSTSLIASLRADYTTLHTDGYTESGSLPSLNVGSNNTDELIVGVDGTLDHSLGEGKSLVANLGAGYDTLAKRDSITSSFVGGGAAFVTKGIDPSPWVINAGVGMNITTHKAWKLSANYNLQARPSNFTNQSVSLKVKIPF